MTEITLQNLEKILINFNRINKDDTGNWASTLSSWTQGIIETPFNIKPEIFLQYAESDLQINDDHHLVNGLSNIKRAIECQIDSLLIGFGLFEDSKKENWNFPKKLEILNEIGIISPGSLRKINKLRNLLEHEYSIPQRDKVEEAWDLATLFIQYTNKFLYGILLDFYSEEVGTCLDHVEVILDYKNSKILFQNEWLGENNQFKQELVEIDHNHPEYNQYIKWYIKMLEKNARFPQAYIE